MKTLSKTNRDYMVELINTLALAKIDTAVIGDWGGVGAMDFGKTYAMLAEAPEFPTIIALTRIDTLEKRLNLFNDGEFDIEYTETGDEASLLKIVSPDESIEYRCSNSKKHNIPKRAVDNIRVSFSLSSQQTGKIIRSVNAFGKDGNLRLELRDGILTMYMRDTTGDECRIKLAKLDNDDLSQVYNAGIVADLLNIATKKNDDGEVTIGIGDNGVLSINCGSFKFYVMAGKE